MNIDDIFADANYRGEESLYPLSKVKSQHDKEKLSEQGYVPGYTVEEWKKRIYSPTSWFASLKNQSRLRLLMR